MINGYERVGSLNGMARTGPTYLGSHDQLWCIHAKDCVEVASIECSNNGRSQSVKLTRSSHLRFC